jgi:hypothetical protein
MFDFLKIAQKVASIILSIQTETNQARRLRCGTWAAMTVLIRTIKGSGRYAAGVCATKVATKYLN